MNCPAVTTPILLPPLVWEPFRGTMYHESILTPTLPLVPFSQPFRLTGGESSLYTPAMFPSTILFVTSYTHRPCTELIYSLHCMSELNGYQWFRTIPTSVVMLIDCDIHILNPYDIQLYWTRDVRVLHTLQPRLRESYINKGQENLIQTVETMGTKEIECWCGWLLAYHNTGLGWLIACDV